MSFPSSTQAYDRYSSQQTTPKTSNTWISTGSSTRSYDSTRYDSPTYYSSSNYNNSSSGVLLTCVIVLSCILFFVLLGNLICCIKMRSRKKKRMAAVSIEAPVNGYHIPSHASPYPVLSQMQQSPITHPYDQSFPNMPMQPLPTYSEASQINSDTNSKP